MSFLLCFNNNALSNFVAESLFLLGVNIIIDWLKTRSTGPDDDSVVLNLKYTSLTFGLGAIIIFLIRNIHGLCDGFELYICLYTIFSIHTRLFRSIYAFRIYTKYSSKYL